ncbi:dicer-like protein 4 [Dorcoceras hygrometricum]|uniref:Dicer-like protein 4 n=1 Tax=Dorcoceras hygrometricum TaxID=472368 RepID=A0A2Z7CCJ7_9LAMI|nr:dicer-like protein 4 [Dorcoceras hygrometricum]
MPWFERITIRVISPTVHGVGYRPLPYDPLVAGHHSMPQNLNFITPSLDSHQSFAGPSGNVDLYDVFVSQQSSAGPSAPSYVYDTMMTSSLVGPSNGQHLTPEHDTLQSFVDQGDQTPIRSNFQSSTDLLNVNLQQNSHDHTERNMVTPIPFPSYSGEQNITADYDTSASSEQNLGDEDVERRRRRPNKCRTGHHLYY